MKHTHSNKVCPVERAGMLDSALRRFFQNPMRILRHYLKPGDKVLDFGCGPGFFTFDIAQLVGESGYVYAADLQEGMLDIIRNKIALSNMQQRIQIHRCEESSINLNDTVDFILAFYMIHELSNQDDTFKEFTKILKPNGRILIIEPNFHVTKKDFQSMILRLEKVGFIIKEKRKAFFNRTVLILKENSSTNT